MPRLPSWPVFVGLSLVGLSELPVGSTVSESIVERPTMMLPVSVEDEESALADLVGRPIVGAGSLSERRPPDPVPKTLGIRAGSELWEFGMPPCVLVPSMFGRKLLEDAAGLDSEYPCL